MAEAELDLHRLQALTRHWRECPPVHVLVAAYLGYEAPNPSPAASAADLQEATGDLAAALAATPQRSALALNDTAWRQGTPLARPVHAPTSPHRHG